MKSKSGGEKKKTSKSALKIKQKKARSNAKSEEKKKEQQKSKLSKAFYDDGLGDMLDWIDGEILAPAELKQLKKRSGDDSKQKKKAKVRLYGDNEVNSESVFPKRKVIHDMPDLDLAESTTKVDKSMTDKCRGLINRLTANTMPYVTSEFEKLYSKNSRITIDSALFDIIEDMIVSREVLAKRKLVAELMLLVSYLSHSINSAIGASLVHRLVKRFEILYNEETKNSEDEVFGNDKKTDKSLENIINCLSNLYITGLISSMIIFEVANRINSGPFTTKSVELLLFLLKGIGFHLRKDASLMRQLILKTQENCNILMEKHGDLVGTRIKFMVDALTAIKNNNVNKLDNYGCDIDTDTIESTLKSLIQRTKLQEPLSNASYEEIVRSTNWYLLETRLDCDGDDTNKNDANDDSKITSQTTNTTDITKNSKLNQREESICRNLKLVKPAEKTVFSALSKCADYTEACTTLMAYGMTYCSDVMSVCCQAAIYAKLYNPFYYKIITNLSQHNRRYKMAAKFAIQDRIRQLPSMISYRVENFRRLTFELIKSDTIPITVLKAIEWANISDATRNYLVWLFEQIDRLPPKERMEIMKKNDKKQEFTDEMQNFCHLFLKDCRLFN